jgi:hypothetical protein
MHEWLTAKKGILLTAAKCQKDRCVEVEVAEREHFGIF